MKQVRTVIILISNFSYKTKVQYCVVEPFLYLIIIGNSSNHDRSWHDTCRGSTTANYSTQS